MGAESPMLVEVEVVTKIWRESYGVTDSDALMNVELGVGERVTGRVIDKDRVDEYSATLAELTGGKDD